MIWFLFVGQQWFGIYCIFLKIRIESNSYYLDFRMFSIRRAEMANHVVFALSRGEKTRVAKKPICEFVRGWYVLCWYDASRITYQLINLSTNKKTKYCYFHRVYWDRHGFGLVSRMNSRTLTLSRVRIGGGMFKTSAGEGRILRFATGSIHWMLHSRFFAVFSFMWEKSCTFESKFYGCKIYGHKRMGIWNSSTAGNWRGKGCKSLCGKI